MNHNRTFACNRLRGLALLFERGELDAGFTAAELPIAAIRESVVRRIRELADVIEGRA